MSRSRRRDPVTADVARAVLYRDQMCVLVKFDLTHVCRDRWGEVHAATDLRRLSIEHVKADLRMGQRAPSDLGHLVAMCHGSNVAVPDKATREQLRLYLASVS